MTGDATEDRTAPSSPSRSLPLSEPPCARGHAAGPRRPQAPLHGWWPCQPLAQVRPLQWKAFVCPSFSRATEHCQDQGPRRAPEEERLGALGRRVGVPAALRGGSRGRGSIQQSRRVGIHSLSVGGGVWGTKPVLTLGVASLAAR